MEVNVRCRPARPKLAAVVLNPDNRPRESMTAGYINPQTNRGRDNAEAGVLDVHFDRELGTQEEHGAATGIA